MFLKFSVHISRWMRIYFSAGQTEKLQKFLLWSNMYCTKAICTVLNISNHQIYGRIFRLLVVEQNDCMWQLQDGAAVNLQTNSCRSPSVTVTSLGQFQHESGCFAHYLERLTDLGTKVSVIWRGERLLSSSQTIKLCVLIRIKPQHFLSTNPSVLLYSKVVRECLCPPWPCRW